MSTPAATDTPLRQRRKDAQAPIVELYRRFRRGKRLRKDLRRVLDFPGKRRRSVGAEPFGQWAIPRLRGFTDPFLTQADCNVRDLAGLQPDLVLSTLSGDSNGAFFDALAGAALTDLPLLSFAAAEPEMRAYGGGRLDRHFTAWAYLQSLPGAANERFLARLRRSQGESAQASDPAVSAYLAVQLWASAVAEVAS